VAINVFEGGRRIAKFIAVVWIIGWGVVAYYDYAHSPPSVNVTYSINSITGAVEPPIRMTEECPPNSMTKYFHMETKSGTKVLVKLCRAASDREELMGLAKLADEEGDLDLAERVLDKIHALENNKPSPSEIAQLKTALVKADAYGNTDEAWIDTRGWSLSLKRLGRVALVAIGGILFLWVFTWVVGWIVRGFIGIPRGQDKKG